MRNIGRRNMNDRIMYNISFDNTYIRVFIDSGRTRWRILMFIKSKLMLGYALTVMRYYLIYFALK